MRRDTLARPPRPFQALRGADPRARQLAHLGITQERIAQEVQRLFPDRTCSRQMVNHVLHKRAKSAFVEVAITRLLEAVRTARGKAS